MMKKLFILLAAVTLLGACDNTTEQPQASPQAPLRASMDGLTRNRCISESITLTAFSQKASSFEWKKDGRVIEGETSVSLTVTESGSYTVAGVNEFGKGSASAAKQVTIISCATTIEGVDMNRCPDEVVMLVASASDTRTFRWEKDGEVIEDHNSATLSASESGTYTATAIYNGVVGEKSAPKTVTVVDCPFVDVLVGEWTVKEDILYLNEIINNNHTIAIEKVDQTTVNIYNFTGDKADQVVIATVDNAARSITIDYQPIAMRDVVYKYCLASVEHSFPGNNIGLSVGTFEAVGRDKGMTITFPTRVLDFRGTELNITWQIIALTQADAYLGQADVGIGTVWTKK